MQRGTGAPRNPLPPKNKKRYQKQVVAGPNHRVPRGMTHMGNINLYSRPVVPDKKALRPGSIATVRSITIGPEGKHKFVLLPTVVGHKILSNQRAIKYYQRTGQNLGTFKSEKAADQYANTLHKQQARLYDRFGRITPASTMLRKYGFVQAQKNYIKRAADATGGAYIGASPRAGKYTGQRGIPIPISNKEVAMRNYSPGDIRFLKSALGTEQSVGSKALDQIRHYTVHPVSKGIQTQSNLKIKGANYAINKMGIVPGLDNILKSHTVQYGIRASLGMPGGIAAAAEHPVRVGGQMAQQYKQAYSSPGGFGRYAKETGGIGPALDALTVGSLGAGAFLKGAELGALGSRAGKFAEAVNSPNTIHLPTKIYKEPGVPVREGAPIHVQLSPRTNPLQRMVQYYKVRGTQKAIDKTGGDMSQMGKAIPSFSRLDHVGRQIRASVRNWYEQAGGKEKLGKPMNNYIYGRVYNTGTKIDPFHPESYAGDALHGKIPLRRRVDSNGDVTYSKAEGLKKEDLYGADFQQYVNIERQMGKNPNFHPTDAEKLILKKFRTNLGVTDVRWVDSRLIKESSYGTNSELPPFLKVLNAVNAPSKFLQVYARPGFTVTNHLQMVAQGIALHGPKYMNYYYHAIKNSKPKDIRDWVHEATGTTRVESFQNKYGESFNPQFTGRVRIGGKYELPFGAGEVKIGRERSKQVRGIGVAPMRRAGQKIIETQSRLTDQIPREAMFYVNAAKEGIKTDAQYHKLMSDVNKAMKDGHPQNSPAMRKLDRIMQRTQDDSIHFSSMTSAERHMASVIYFYPYLSRAVRWTSRYSVEHPVSTNVLSKLGNIGIDQEAKKLGGEPPDWMLGYIPTRAGLVNPSPANTFATPAQITAGFIPSAYNRNLASEYGTPLLQGLFGERRQGQDFLEKLSEVMVGNTAPGQMLKRAGIDYAPILGPIPKTWKQHPGELGRLMDILGPFLFGGLFPRSYHPAEVRRQTRKLHGVGVSGRGGGGGLPSYLPSSGSSGYSYEGGSSGGGYSYLP